MNSYIATVSSLYGYNKLRVPAKRSHYGCFFGGTFVERLLRVHPQIWITTPVKVT